MGADRSNYTDGIAGIVFPDTRLTHANETVQGVAATSSAYTQSGPLPGVPVAQQNTEMILQATGAQSASGDLEVYALRAGMPGRDSGAMAWRDVAAGDTATQYRGWDGFQIIRDWTTVRAVTSGTYVESVLGCLRLATGVVLIYGDQDDSTTSYAQRIYRYNPDTGTTSAVTPTTYDNIADYGSAMVQLEDRRILWFVPNGSGSTRNLDMYVSSTGGLTWSLKARNVLKDGLVTPSGHTALSPRELRAAYVNGQISLWWRFQSTDGGATPRMSMAQFASSTLGTSFETVLASWYATYAEQIFNGIAVIASDGAFCLIAQFGGSAVRARTYATAYTTPTATGASVFTIGNGTIAEEAGLTAWVDEEGVMWCVVRDSPTTSSGSLEIARSRDGGASWPEELYFCIADNAYGVGTSNYPHSFGMTSTAGRGILATRWETASGSYDDRSVGIIFTGGDSTHTAPIRSTRVSSYPDCLTQITSYDSGVTDRAGSYIPFDIPNNIGWSTAGTGATGNSSIQVVSSEAVLEVDTTGGGFPSWSFYQNNTNASVTACYAMFVVDEVSGGSTGNDIVAAKVRLSDGATWGYEVQIRLSSAQFRLFDTGAGSAIGNAVTVSGKIWFVVALSKTSGPTGRVQTWYTTDTGHDKIWTAGPGTPSSGAAMTNGFGGGITDNRIQFGHFQAGSSAKSRWWLVTYCQTPGAFVQGGSTDIGDSDEAGANPDELHGRNFSATGTRIYDGVIVSAIRGPALIGDAWRIAARYQYPVDHLYPLVVPSPSQVWRTTSDGADALVVWQWAVSTFAQRFSNFSLAVGLFNSNFRTALLEGYNGAAWVTIASIDTATGHAGLSYSSAGGCLSVRSGSTTASRYFWHDEFAGASVKMTDGATTSYRHLTGNTQGEWRDSTTVKQSLLYLSDFDGTEAANGTIDILARDSVTVVHNITATNYQFIRLKIATQDVADNYFQIGTCVIGALTPFGYRFSHGWSREMQANVATFERPSGLLRTYIKGPSARDIVIGWDDALLHQDVVSGTDPAYIRAVSSGSIVSSKTDVLQLMEYAARSANGPHTPMLLLPQVPTTDGTITDPTRFALVRLMTNPRFEDVRGRYGGTNAMGRMGKLTFREER